MHRRASLSAMLPATFTAKLVDNKTMFCHSIIESVDADFDSKEVEKHYIFPIDQKFIIDKEKNIHLYKE